MKLLLTKDISHLGIVGDVVDVSPGYARNFLLPNHLATQANAANMRALAEERKKAEERRRLAREAMAAAADRLRDVEVTIAAAANEEGVLYGSVGPREIAAALRDEGHEVNPSAIHLAEPVRRLDKVSANVRFTDDISAEVKVWVVRSQATPGAEDEDEDRDEGFVDEHDE